MPKNWTPAEDMFLVDFFDAVGADIGPRDLGRSLAATKARVKKLKASGAWSAYRTAAYHKARAIDLAGHARSELERDWLLDEMADKTPDLTKTAETITIVK